MKLVRDVWWTCTQHNKHKQSYFPVRAVSHDFYVEWKEWWENMWLDNFKRDDHRNIGQKAFLWMWRHVCFTGSFLQLAFLESHLYDFCAYNLWITREGLKSAIEGRQYAMITHLFENEMNEFSTLSGYIYEKQRKQFLNNVMELPFRTGDISVIRHMYQLVYQYLYNTMLFGTQRKAKALIKNKTMMYSALQGAITIQHNELAHHIINILLTLDNTSKVIKTCRRHDFHHDFQDGSILEYMNKHFTTHFNVDNPSLCDLGKACLGIVCSCALPIVLLTVEPVRYMIRSYKKKKLANKSWNILFGENTY